MRSCEKHLNDTLFNNTSSNGLNRATSGEEKASGGNASDVHDVRLGGAVKKLSRYRPGQALGVPRG